jgi:hypothetical protein
VPCAPCANDANNDYNINDTNTGDFLSQFDVLLREALTSEKIRLSKAQVNRANRAIIRDAATEFDLQYIQEVHH